MRAAGTQAPRVEPDPRELAVLEMRGGHGGPSVARALDCEGGGRAELRLLTDGLDDLPARAVMEVNAPATTDLDVGMAAVGQLEDAGRRRRRLLGGLRRGGLERRIIVAATGEQRRRQSQRHKHTA